MTPVVGGAINSSFFSRYDATVQAALNSATQPYVILDLVGSHIVYFIGVDQ